MGGMGIWHRLSTSVYRPHPEMTAMTWIGDTRVAVGRLPTGASLPRLRDDGITHVVNCRARQQVWVSGDLGAERRMFGYARVAHAPMWDHGLAQPPGLWAGAARFAAGALDDPDARVLIHCQQGRRRSVMVAYAVLRLRGHDPDAAVALIAHRRE